MGTLFKLWLVMIVLLLLILWLARGSVAQVPAVIGANPVRSSSRTFVDRQRKKYADVRSSIRRN